jgi:hypothetical protein
MIQNITANISAPIRHDTMEGRNYLVAPMIMLTEGVHAGSNGPLLYPKEELSKTPVVWNHKPVVVYHPTMNGQGVSACDPDVITNRKVGVIMNARFDNGKLHAEAWLEKDRADKVDGRIMKAIEANTVMELSTGLFTDNESSDGEWNGKKYVAIARNYRPDHLALLPDKKGACSIEDGAGFLRLNEVKGTSFVERLKSANATIQEALVLLENNVSSAHVEDKFKEKDMKKEEMVNALIANAKWEEADRPFLMNQDEKVLEKMMPAEKTETEKKTEEEVSKKLVKLEAFEKAETEKKAAEEGVNKGTQNQEVTADQYIANAPIGIRDMLLDGLSAHQAEKNKLIGTITANKKNVFTKEHLANKNLFELRGMVALLSSDEKKPVNFAGLGETTNAVTEEPLMVPVLNFGK